MAYVERIRLLPFSAYRASKAEPRRSYHNNSGTDDHYNRYDTCTRLRSTSYNDQANWNSNESKEDNFWNQFGKVCFAIYSEEGKDLHNHGFKVCKEVQGVGDLDQDACKGNLCRESHGYYIYEEKDLEERHNYSELRNLP